MRESQLEYWVRKAVRYSRRPHQTLAGGEVCSIRIVARLKQEWVFAVFYKRVTARTRGCRLWRTYGQAVFTRFFWALIGSCYPRTVGSPPSQELILDSVSEVLEWLLGQGLQPLGRQAVCSFQGRKDTGFFHGPTEPAGLDERIFDVFEDRYWLV